MRVSYAELGEWPAFCRRQGKKTANNYLTDRSATVEWKEDTVGVNHSHSPRLTDTTAAWWRNLRVDGANVISKEQQRCHDSGYQ